MTKEKPILFNTPMVQKILSGEKTCTRRPVKANCGLPALPLLFANDGYIELMEHPFRESKMIELTGCVPQGSPKDGELFWLIFDKDWRLTSGSVSENEIRTPYKPGDVMYVRETWMPETENGIPTGAYIYKATDRPEPDGNAPLVWRPSIHMPKEASRISLAVKRCWIEQVTSIIEEHARMEGFDNREMFLDWWRDFYCEGRDWEDDPPLVFVFPFEVLKIKK